MKYSMCVNRKEFWEIHTNLRAIGLTEGVHFPLFLQIYFTVYSRIVEKAPMYAHKPDNLYFPDRARR